MVLTVTLNPLLERRISFSEVHYGNVNRNGLIELKAGGKGINVSRQLNKLSIENTLLTFAGGGNGKIFKDIIYKEGLKPVLIRTESETREGVVIIDQSNIKITSCFGFNQEVTQKEAAEFKEKLLKMIPNFEIIVFSGSSPSEVTDMIFPEAIQLCNELDKVSICDTYGVHLQSCIDAHPTVLHNNITELQNSLGVDTEKNITEFLHDLYNKDIKQSFITDGASSFYASNFDFLYKIKIPKINEADPTGSGDAFCAGIVYGWHNDLVFDEMLKTAASLGAVNASSFETCSVEKNDALKYHDEVIVESFGKKMKQIDVTPQ